MRVLKIRVTMPNASSILTLMSSLAIEKELKTYKCTVNAIKDIEERKE